jgi:hypothetical protein
MSSISADDSCPASESEWPPFSSLRLFLILPVNSQTKTSKVRDDKLGGGDHFSAAERMNYPDIIGLEEREHGALVGVIGSM